MEVEPINPPAEPGPAEPPEAPPIADPADTPGETRTDEPPADPPEDPEPPRSFSQDEVNDIVQKRLEKERRRMDARIDAILAERRPDQQRQQQPPAEEEKPLEVPPTRPKPRIEDHEYNQESYLEDLADWKMEQRDAKAKAEAQRAEQKKHQEAQSKTEQETRQQYENKRVSMIENGIKRYQDFEDVAFSVPMDELTGAMVLDTETPAEIAYHLGKNPQEFERLSKMTPLKRAIEIGKIEATIQAAARKPSEAPTPPTPVRGKAPAATSSAKLAKDSTSDWIKKRRAGKI